MDSLDSHLNGVAPKSSKGQFCPHCDGEVKYRANDMFMVRCGHCKKLFGESKIVRR